MVSAGEVHTPGRPKDIVGLKAMAIFAQRAISCVSSRWSKGLLRVRLYWNRGMVEEDFEDLAAAGVKFLGEARTRQCEGWRDCGRRQMVGWAPNTGIQSTIHTGGPSIPGSSLIDKDMVLETDADVIGHINGGHTALA